MTLIKRHFSDPNQSFFLFGPRGTGKSTLIRTLYENALWIDLLKPEVLRGYLARPEKLVEIIDGEPNKKSIVIDEIQKAPQLLSVIHHLIEQKRGLKFILIGSSARRNAHGL